MHTQNWNFWYLMIFTIPLIFNPMGFGPYEIPKQLFLVIMIAFVFMNFITNRGKEQSVCISSLTIFMAFWLSSLILSGLFGESPYESFWGSTERLQGIWTWGLYIAHFFICLKIFKDSRLLKIFLNITIGIGIILSFYAILQQFGIDPFNISDIDMASGRSFATAGHPNFLGQFLIFPIITLFVRIMKNAGGTKKILLTTALLFTFTGLLTTFNRASILGILLAICFLKLYKTSGKKRLKFVIIGLFLTIITASMLTYTGGLRSLNSRINLLQPIGALLIENPIFGSGIETFYKTYQKVATKEIYLTENLYDIPDRIHNEPLQVLLDQGAIGFLLYLMTIIFLIWIFIKHKLQTDNQITAYFAILAYLISMQFSFSLSLHMIFLLGMWAVLFADKNLGKQAFKVKTFKIPEKIIIWLLKPAALLLCIFYMYTAVSMLYADIYFAKGMKSYLKSSTEAEQFFAESLSLNPNSRYYLYNAANLLMGNTETLARLGKITNDGYHYDIAIANYLGKNGDLKGANKHFEIAAKKAPNWPLIWQMWGDFLFEEKMYTDAITKYEKLINLAPPYWKWPEKYRIFKKNHELFFISLQRLNKAYKELGDTRKSHELESYIFQ